MLVCFMLRLLLRDVEENNEVDKSIIDQRQTAVEHFDVDSQ